MASITQDLRFKQAVIEYSLAHGATKAATRYRKTSTIGEDDITAIYDLCCPCRAGRTLTRERIRKRKYGSSKTCASATPMRDW